MKSEEEIDRLREEIRRISETRKVYKENLKLCKWQEQQINRLATAIEKIAKIVEGTYEALDSQANRVYYPTTKGITLCGEAGGGCAKMGQYFFGDVIKDFKDLDLSEYKYPCFVLQTNKGNEVLLVGYIRKLTPIECERLQTLPDNYTAYGIDGKISSTQRYKCIGNGWTVDVIAHIFSFLKQELDKQ